MTPNQPPRIATWMLKHFGSGANNDAVLGDLAEQYQKKASAIWYWRQAMKAIPVSFVRDIRGNKWGAARTLLVGWCMWIVGGMLVFPLVFGGTNVGFAFDPNDPIGSFWSFMWMPALGSASIHPDGPWTTPLSFLTAIVLPLIVGWMCGMLVGRWHIVGQRNPFGIRVEQVRRDHQTAAVLLFAGSILLTYLLLIAPWVMIVGNSVAYLLAGLLMANIAGSVLGIVIGGGLLRDREKQKSMIEP